MNQHWLCLFAVLVCITTTWNSVASARGGGQDRTNSSPTQSVNQQSTRPQTVVKNLKDVRRICIEDFEGGEGSNQLRALFIDKLNKTGLFVVTENPDLADAYVRGFGRYGVYEESHELAESQAVRSSASASTGGYTRNRVSTGSSVAVNDSTRLRQDVRRNEALLSIRIVNYDGDILWSGSAHSAGGKYKNATIDVAERLAASVCSKLRPNR